MKTLDRYLIRELIIPSLIGQFAVVLMLTGTVLYNNAGIFLSYHIAASDVARVVVYFLPYLIHMTMPVATAIAASLAVSRLTRDSEITVMRSSGISLKRIFLPIFIIGLVLSVLDFFLGENLVPLSNRQMEATLASISRNLHYLVPQERTWVESPDHRYIAYVGRMVLAKNGVQTYNVMIGQIGDSADNSLPRIAFAKWGTYRNGIWDLHDVFVHNYLHNGLEEQFIKAKQWIINFRIAEQNFILIQLQLPFYSSSSTMSFSQLGHRLVEERKAGGVNPNDLLDYYFKLSVPFSCLVFAICCPPLSLRFARTGNFTGVLLSIILVFVYWNTMLLSKILGYQGLLPPLIAAWSQDILFVLAGLVVLRGEE